MGSASAVFVAASNRTAWDEALNASTLSGVPLWMAAPYGDLPETPDLSVAPDVVITGLAHAEAMRTADGLALVLPDGWESFVPAPAADSLAAYAAGDPSPAIPPIWDGAGDQSHAWIWLTAMSNQLEPPPPMVAGSGAGRRFVPHGAGLHDELRLLTALFGTAAFDVDEPREEAVRAATRGAAEALGFERLGDLAPAFTSEGPRPLADLIVSNVDFASVSSAAGYEDVKLVMSRGAYWLPEELLTQELIVTPSSGRCLDDGDCPTSGEYCARDTGVCGPQCTGDVSCTGEREVCRYASGHPVEPPEAGLQVCAVPLDFCEEFLTTDCLAVPEYLSTCIEKGSSGVGVCRAANQSGSTPASCDYSFPEHLCPEGQECALGTCQ